MCDVTFHLSITDEVDERGVPSAENSAPELVSKGGGAGRGRGRPGVCNGSIARSARLAASDDDESASLRTAGVERRGDARFHDLEDPDRDADRFQLELVPYGGAKCHGSSFCVVGSTE